MNQLSRQDIIKLLPLNQLLYTSSAPSNPITERAQKKSYSEGGSGTSYTSNDHIRINFQSGLDWIDGKQSFLVFDIKATDGTADTSTAYMVGSAMNVIRDIKITTRSGKEIDSFLDLNLHNYHRIKNMPEDMILHNAAVLYLANDAEGTPPSNTDLIFTTNVGAAAPYESAKKRVMIPLKYLSGIFNSDKLIPPHLARGLTLDMTLESFATAFTGAAGGVTGYEISKPYVLLDSYRMADSVLEFINSEFASKKSGLVFEYDSYHTTKSTMKSTAINQEVRRSVSMALDVYAAIRKTVNVPDVTKNSFGSIEVDEKDETQWRVGSHFLPNQPTVGVVEHYAQRLYQLNKLRDDKIVGVKRAEFVNYCGTYAMTLQRNNILDLSGLQLNNSQTLSIDGTLTNGEDSNVNIYLRHLRRLVIFLETLTLQT